MRTGDASFLFMAAAIPNVPDTVNDGSPKERVGQCSGGLNTPCSLKGRLGERPGRVPVTKLQMAPYLRRWVELRG